VLPSDCEACPDVCCDGLYTATTTILDVAHDAVVECADADCCGAYRKFISVGEPHWSQGDYVAAWASELTLDQPNSNPNPKMLLGAQPRVVVNVKLMESGWPTITGVAAGPEIIEPDPSAVDVAARHSYAHAQRMFTKTLNAVMLNNLACCKFLAITGLRPVGPSGGLVGWMFAIKLETRW
jgi:hypothetical protein